VGAVFVAKALIKAVIKSLIHKFTENVMPISKRPTKKALMSTTKCPRCGSRSYKQKEKLNIFEKFISLGCKMYVCQKCNKKWAA